MWLLLLVNPHRYFSLDPTSSIDILNISFVNERQAAEIFFDRLKEDPNCKMLLTRAAQRFATTLASDRPINSSVFWDSDLTTH